MLVADDVVYIDFVVWKEIWGKVSGCVDIDVKYGCVGTIMHEGVSSRRRLSRCVCHDWCVVQFASQGTQTRRPERVWTRLPRLVCFVFRSLPFPVFEVR